MFSDSNQKQVCYEVVTNQEGQYSIWPADMVLSKGWSTVGKQGTQEICLAFIGEVWTDMRPLSVRS